jgi:hypothetical protein
MNKGVVGRPRLLIFHLLPKIKKHLRGQRFHFNEDVQNKVKLRL